MAARGASTKTPAISWHEAHPAPVVLVSGPETFLADRAVQRIRETLLAERSDLEQHQLDAASYTAGELFTIASPSLFAEPRLIRVSNVERCSDAFLADARQYVTDPADDATLVLRHAGGQRGKALLDLVRGGAGIDVSCPEMKKDQERAAFAQAELRSLGATVTPGAVRQLIAAYTGDLGELAGACAQLVEVSGKQLNEDHVTRATEGRVETNGFKVADAATAGRPAEALLLLRQAFAGGIDPIPLLAALNMKIRGMARVFGARGSAGQLAKELGMAPWQVERAMKDTRGWREEDLARAINMAAETEWLLKGGARDPQYALEKYVLFVARRGRS